MKTLFTTILLSLLFQGGGQSINIPIPITSFAVGYGSSFSQDLGVTPAHFQEFKPGYSIQGLYTLSFSVANAANSSNYPGYYKARISFGTQELCEPDGWGTPAYSQVTHVCPGPGYIVVDQSLSCDQNPCITTAVQGNKNLILTVTGNGWETSFKNVALTFTPGT